MNQPPDNTPGNFNPARPAEAQGRPVYTLSEPPAPVETGPNKVLIGIIGASVLLVGFGVFRMAFAKPEPPKPQVQVQSIWSEQQNMMREAMNMAREAQALQRERMEMMRVEAEGDYSYFAEPASAPHDSDW